MNKPIERMSVFAPVCASNGTYLKFLCVALSLFCHFAWMQRTLAADSASCTALEIAASRSGKGVSAELAALKTVLSKPPFTVWDSFSLSSKKQASVGATEASLALSKSKLLLRLISRVKTAKSERLKVAVRLLLKGKQALSSTFTFNAGRTEFPYAGGPENDGYIVALTCK